MMNSDLLSKIKQSILIEPIIKDQIIDQRYSLTPEQQQMIENYILMGSDIEGDLYQIALDNNPKLQQGLQQIIHKHQITSLASLGNNTDEADQLLNNLPH